ncbi:MULTISPECIES: ABC transporter substrate-binding protein [Paenibacillus]|uniref:Transporter substrate-binding domain-containing protein n=1 Tax=Paenibacillus xylanilyticus TaxID=248903 RepID=A0A7Y6BUC3_9BACL|nr:ABC transporter substrate-binding protein [Paenibacillus xylanilyticus]NUU74581.1 transporter substrate-binding domain-containing protein [Paenibacillus xylanilyticus]
MKRVLLPVILMLMVVIMSACGQKQTTGSASEPASSAGGDAKEKEVIVLGTSADYAPYEFHKSMDGKDTIVGFDIEIAKAIAADLGAELKIEDMDFDGLLMALDTGKVDFVISGLTPTEERKKNVDFTDIYYYAEQAVLVREGEGDALNSLDDLSGKLVGVQKSSIQEGIAQAVEGAKLTSLAKIPELILELQTGRVDALILEKPVAEQYVKNQQGLALSDVKIEQAEDEAGSAIAVKKGNQELVDQINSTLAKLKSNGDIERFVVEANELVGD